MDSGLGGRHTSTSAGIAWQYEPVRLSGWTPDFRLALNGGEAYAEVKPVSEFPMDVAQRVLNAGWTGDILILGLEPRHAWRHRGDGWTRWAWPHENRPLRWPARPDACPVSEALTATSSPSEEWLTSRDSAGSTDGNHS